MCSGNLTVTIIAWALCQCPYVPRHTFVSGTVLCPYEPGHFASAHMCPGILLFSICAREPFRWPYVPEKPSVTICGRHHSGAHMCPGILLFSTCAWEPTRVPCLCPYVHEHHYSAHISLDIPVLMCTSTIQVPICCLAPFWCPYVPGHPFGSDTCSGSLPVPICAWAPFWCSYLGTIEVPKCDPAPFQVPVFSLVSF